MEEEEAIQEEEVTETPIPVYNGLLRPQVVDFLIQPELAQQLKQECPETALSSKQKLIFKDGNTFEGDIVDGRLHGQGIYVWKDGTVYTGAFDDNRINGRGKLHWENGDTYHGDFLNGLRHGSGMFKCSLTKAEYRGEWKYGVRCGTGTATFADGSKYIGQWKNNLRHGKGQMTYYSGNVYDGQWECGKRVGFGEMTWINKYERYSGEWYNGLPNGFGEHIWMTKEDFEVTMNDDKTFQDDLADDIQERKKNPKAKKFRNWYRGNWVAGMRQGKGTFYYSDGSQYIGLWSENHKHGPNAMYLFPDGRIYQGTFVRDNMVDKIPSGANDSPGGIKVELQIDDLLVPGVGMDVRKTKREVDNVLLRLNSEMKKAYYMCCGEQSSKNGIVASAASIWDLFYSCNIPDDRITIAQVNRLLVLIQTRHLKQLNRKKTPIQMDSTINEYTVDNQENRKTIEDQMTPSKDKQQTETTLNASGEENDMEVTDSRDIKYRHVIDVADLKLHEPTRPVLFKDFVELVVRVANQKYFYDFSTLAPRVNRLLQGNLAKYLLQQEPVLDGASMFVPKFEPRATRFTAPLGELDEREEDESYSEAPKRIKIKTDVVMNQEMKSLLKNLFHRLGTPSKHASSCMVKHFLHITPEWDYVTTPRQLLKLLLSKGLITAQLLQGGTLENSIAEPAMEDTGEEEAKEENKEEEEKEISDEQDEVEETQTPVEEENKEEEETRNKVNLCAIPFDMALGTILGHFKTNGIQKEMSLRFLHIQSERLCSFKFQALLRCSEVLNRELVENDLKDILIELSDDFAVETSEVDDSATQQLVFEELLYRLIEV